MSHLNVLSTELPEVPNRPECPVVKLSWIKCHKVLENDSCQSGLGKCSSTFREVGKPVGRSVEWPVKWWVPVPWPNERMGCNWRLRLWGITRLHIYIAGKKRVYKFLCHGPLTGWDNSKAMKWRGNKYYSNALVQDVLLLFIWRWWNVLVWHSLLRQDIMIADAGDDHKCWLWTIIRSQSLT